ncbi:MAG TPA: Hpt domain-containing protein [Rhizomicrobium sp.]|nr:Hpt domain-containing protein [Rhizomicrobium sp.]
MSDVIDMDHLARYTGGDATLNAEILRLFEAQANELVGKLRAILEARDAKSWKEVTHTIKGAARGVGAFALADAAAACEKLDVGDPGTASRAIDDLKTHTDAVQGFIRSRLTA